MIPSRCWIFELDLMTKYALKVRGKMIDRLNIMVRFFRFEFLSLDDVSFTYFRPSFMTCVRLSVTL